MVSDCGMFCFCLCSKIVWAILELRQGVCLLRANAEKRLVPLPCCALSLLSARDRAVRVSTAPPIGLIFSLRRSRPPAALARAHSKQHRVAARGDACTRRARRVEVAARDAEFALEPIGAKRCSSSSLDPWPAPVNVPKVGNNFKKRRQFLTIPFTRNLLVKFVCCLFLFVLCVYSIIVCWGL